MKIEKDRPEKQPYFVRFLEKQELEKVSGARPPHTLRYPSDDDTF